MYKIVFLKEVDKDLLSLDYSLKIEIFKKLKQISQFPEIWKNLWNKMWLNLSWYKKVYVNSKKVWIVYKIIDEKIEILIIAIWKRENEIVYKNAFNRIK